MKIIITGAAGFLGQELAKALLQNGSPLDFHELLLVDAVAIPIPKEDSRIHCLTLDLSDPTVADKIIDSRCSVIFHLAAVVSGQAESDFDFGMKVNFDATRYLLEAARQKVPNVKFVFTSTCGVFGGKLPPVIDDYTAVTPENSYGMEKALCELLINDFSRRGFIDGRVIRLPTITIRPGKANKAVTSFVSVMIREPLNGVKYVIPVSKDLPIWVCSPATVIQNIIHASIIQGQCLKPWRIVNLPGITVTVEEMIKALRVAAGDKVVSLLGFQQDDAINKIVVTFPRYFDVARALKLGFHIDKSYEDIIQAYLWENV